MGHDSETLDKITTLERILQQEQHPLFARLVSLWRETQKLPNAWIFPAEKNGVDGFAGLAPVFVIGEQPSGNRWPPHDRGRRLLYDSLLACGASHVHLTDIVKSRGKGHEAMEWPHERLEPHINLLNREIEDLGPARIVLLGTHARDLFVRYFPKRAASAAVVEHFGRRRWIRAENLNGWEEDFRRKLARALE